MPNCWIDVTDRLPDKEQEAIVMIKHAEISTVLYYNGESFVDTDFTAYPVTHWMPLPDPPLPRWQDAMLHTFLGGR